MEPHGRTDAGETSETHSHDASGREAAGDPNDTSHAGGGGDLSGGELKTAVSAAAAQLTQHLSVIESSHLALMERLQRIAEQADDRARHQFNSLREQRMRGNKLAARARTMMLRGYPFSTNFR